MVSIRSEHLVLVFVNSLWPKAERWKQFIGKTQGKHSSVAWLPQTLAGKTWVCWLLSPCAAPGTCPESGQGGNGEKTKTRHGCHGFRCTGLSDRELQHLVSAKIECLLQSWRKRQGYCMQLEEVGLLLHRENLESGLLYTAGSRTQA